MAIATVPMSTRTPGATTVVSARTVPAWLAPALAVGIGSLSGVIATYAIIATQTLHMSL